jgi:hypothetical protein
MALDDRDHNFEKALGRHLRGDVRREACPEADVLAAYHERSMSPEELNSWKHHIAACARCQEVLIQLEATDAIPMNVDRPESILAMRRPEMAMAISMDSAPAALPQSVPAKGVLPFSNIRRKASLRWFAPLGAVAAGLLVWVTLREAKTPAPHEEKSVQIAQNRDVAPPATIAPASVEPPARSDTMRQTEKVPTAKVDSGRRVSRDSEKSEITAGVAPKSTVAAVAAAPAENDRVAGDRVALENDLRAANRPDLTLDVVQEQKKSEMSRVAAPSPPQPSVAKIATADAAAPEVAAKQKAAGAVAATSQTVEITSQTAEVPSNFKKSSALRLEAAQNARLILATDGKSAWRLGSAGIIEYSSNGGKKWVPQASGVASDLLAGSAPSKKVCWVVGRAGIILLTADGGATWKQLPSPIADDLGGIHAADALRATIRDVANHRSYETSDAGLTWHPVASE